MTFEKNKNFVLRKIHDTFFFIDITDNYKENKCRLIETNEIGDFIWKNLDRANSIEEISQLLIELIDDNVPYDMVYKDIVCFMDSLYEKGIVIKN